MHDLCTCGLCGTLWGNKSAEVMFSNHQACVILGTQGKRLTFWGKPRTWLRHMYWRVSSSYTLAESWAEAGRHIVTPETHNREVAKCECRLAVSKDETGANMWQNWKNRNLKSPAANQPRGLQTRFRFGWQFFRRMKPFALWRIYITFLLAPEAPQTDSSSILSNTCQFVQIWAVVSRRQRDFAVVRSESIIPCRWS